MGVEGFAQRSGSVVTALLQVETPQQSAAPLQHAAFHAAVASNHAGNISELSGAEKEKV